jgi:endonuclease/exonuclease/phosphatase family metal-dependent hydrolase
VRRTSPGSVFFTTYNLLNLFADDSPAAREHYETIVGVIRSLDPDVLAVQEVLAACASSRTTLACAARYPVPMRAVNPRSRSAATAITWD